VYLSSFRLDGRTAIVTGASRGIGRVLAIGLAEAGADVALVARSRDDLEGVAQEIDKVGRTAYVVPADMTCTDQITEAVKEVESRAGRIDILVNNAGMNIRTPALDVTEEEWQKLIDTNLKSAFMMSQATARKMKDTGYGRIVNVASVGGLVALRTGAVYGITKAGMTHMTRILALEWARYGINVNAIAPWYVNTPLTEKLLANQEYTDEVLSVTLIKRIEEPRDLVGATVFLCGDAASFITGQVLAIDGGMTIYGF